MTYLKDHNPSTPLPRAYIHYGGDYEKILGQAIDQYFERKRRERGLPPTTLTTSPKTIDFTLDPDFASEKEIKTTKKNSNSSSNLRFRLHSSEMFVRLLLDWEYMDWVNKGIDPSRPLKSFDELIEEYLEYYHRTGKSLILDPPTTSRKTIRFDLDSELSSKDEVLPQSRQVRSPGKR